MADNRKIRAKKNILTSLVSQIVVLLCGIVVPRLMIGEFGSEAYGATTSITQFLAYITLLEGGIGGVARAVLYKPLAQKDMDTIGAVMEEVRKFFSVVAWIFVGYVLILACGFQSLSQAEGMDWITSFVLVIVISISTFGQYFIGISYSILLQADQKSYITHAVSIGATVINAISIVVLILLGCDLIAVKLVSSCIFFMRPVVLWLYVKKRYPIKKHKPVKGTTFLTQRWTGLSQHIAYFLHSNTDIAVLTVLTDLRTVAVYSVYNMIITHIQNLTMSFISGMEAVFGDMLARDEQEQLQKAFGAYETILSVMAVILFSATAVLIVPFIKIYTAGITDTDYIQPIFAGLLVLTVMSYCLRLPYHSMVIAAGHFKQTSWAAYGEALINISLSVILVSRFGLSGVAAATLAATWFRFVYYVIYLSRNIFCRKIRLFIKRFLVNVAVIAANYLLGNCILSAFPITNYLSWALCGVVLAATMSVVTFGVNLCFFRKDSLELLRKYIK
jgi:O-antigen/teichoic acid export membrane protein